MLGSIKSNSPAPHFSKIGIMIFTPERKFQTHKLTFSVSPIIMSQALTRFLQASLSHQDASFVVGNLCDFSIMHIKLIRDVDVQTDKFLAGIACCGCMCGGGGKLRRQIRRKRYIQIERCRTDGNRQSVGTQCQPPSTKWQITCCCWAQLTVTVCERNPPRGAELEVRGLQRFFQHAEGPARAPQSL